MLVCKTISELRENITHSKKEGKAIGFVPTMGALHHGHLSLVDQCNLESNITVVSIFVNPTQFNSSDDFDKYPNTLEDDLRALDQRDVDFVFLPSVADMYQEFDAVNISFGYLEKRMEGAYRPGHFSGVGVVVSKLFNIVQPDKCFLGQKDLQQVAVIKLLVKTLNFPVKIISVPTVRESNGLAMSSRNMRLSRDERERSALIYKVLQNIKNDIQSKVAFESAKKTWVKELSESGFEVEYLELVDALTLNPCDYNSNKEMALCVAVYISTVRLIDNIVF